MSEGQAGPGTPDVSETAYSLNFPTLPEPTLLQQPQEFLAAGLQGLKFVLEEHITVAISHILGE